MTTKPVSPLGKLREPFADNLVSKLPKETRAQIDARKENKNLMVWHCPECGGAHHKAAIHLDYVGHAALTDRLLDTDITWSWEPLAFDAVGLPAFDGNGGLWIKLTVCGVTRLGYGSADGKTGGDAKKEIIGDALRNAAMRFGAALDLWHKGTLRAEEEVDLETGEITPANDKGNGHAEKMAAERNRPFPPGPARNKTELKEMVRQLWSEVEGCGDPDELDALLKAKETVAMVTQLIKAQPTWWEGETKGDEQFEGLEQVISRKQSELLIAVANAG